MSLPICGCWSSFHSNAHPNGHGVPIDLCGTWEKPYTGSTVSTVRQYKAMQAMIQRARDVYPGKNVVCIPLFDWCDDVDPAVSVKYNRQQLWCKSNTGTDNTYIVGLGGKKQDHYPLEELYLAELASLRSNKVDIF
jgi:hypothetical protein